MIKEFTLPKHFLWILMSLSTITTTTILAQTPFDSKLQQKGITKSDVKDWSKSDFIEMPIPQCALINISGIERMPVSKDEVLSAWIETYDGQGNFFRKPVHLSAQGNSSLGFVKKNFKADFSSESLTFSIGDWVRQDEFHFKAYYTDFFRGVGCVAYQLFHQTQQDRGPMWKRAFLTSSNKNARCYPDGFPCLVYLNGDFYGIFAWQLKKDRKNMSQTKEMAEHIHLDGKFDNDIFWSEHIDWTQFEVRNPKGLYCMNGQLYDGDHPQELIDETSAFYDLPEDSETIKARKKKSAKVKHYVEAFSTFHHQLKSLETQGADTETIREAMSLQFDIPSLTDYICFAYYVNNYDGFWKNWQWFTYDGSKWFVAPYDLDCTFGNHASGNFIIPPEWNFEWGNYSFLLSREPINFFRKYFWEDIKVRYAELREQKIFSPDNLQLLLTDWYDRIGIDSYAEEWQRWPDSKCIGKTICNPSWMTSDDWTGYGKLPDYDSETTYHAGDRCRLAERVWTATAYVKGVQPYIQLGYTDNLERVFAWVKRRTEIIDQFMGYNPEENYIGSIRQAADTPTTINTSIYDLSGQRILHLQKGINIVSGRKILVK